MKFILTVLFKLCNTKFVFHAYNVINENDDDFFILRRKIFPGHLKSPWLMSSLTNLKRSKISNQMRKNHQTVNTNKIFFKRLYYNSHVSTAFELSVLVCEVCDNDLRSYSHIYWKLNFGPHHPSRQTLPFPTTPPTLCLATKAPLPCFHNMLISIPLALVWLQILSG